MPTIITRGAASARGFGFGGIFVAPPGQQAYTTAGTYSWVAPAGVTSVSVVAVGTGGDRKSGINPANGGGGAGAGLGYKNNYAVTPGSSYTVVVGALATSTTDGNDSYFVSTGVVKGGGGAGQPNPTTRAVGGTYTGDGGGNGGCGGTGNQCAGPVWGAGGGAGGYSGAGGIGGNAGGNAGTAGAGGGGGGGYGQNGNVLGAAVGGGGVGILGQGTSGAASTCASKNGKGGSGGTNGTASGGGTYGGGTGGNTASPGAVRIIWPGTTRQFPSTCTGDK